MKMFPIKYREPEAGWMLLLPLVLPLTVSLPVVFAFEPIKHSQRQMSNFPGVYRSETILIEKQHFDIKI